MTYPDGQWMYLADLLWDGLRFLGWFLLIGTLGAAICWTPGLYRSGVGWASVLARPSPRRFGRVGRVGRLGGDRGEAEVAAEISSGIAEIEAYLASRSP
jgi:hypothetical protein